MSTENKENKNNNLWIATNAATRNYHDSFVTWKKNQKIGPAPTYSPVRMLVRSNLDSPVSIPGNSGSKGDPPSPFSEHHFSKGSEAFARWNAESTLAYKFSYRNWEQRQRGKRPACGEDDDGSPVHLLDRSDFGPPAKPVQLAFGEDECLAAGPTYRRHKKKLSRELKGLARRVHWSACTEG